jgi:hypothetical protein
VEEAVKKGTVTGWVGPFLTKNNLETSIRRGERKNLMTGEAVKKGTVTGWVGAFLMEKYPESYIKHKFVKNTNMSI